MFKRLNQAGLSGRVLRQTHSSEISLIKTNTPTKKPNHALCTTLSHPNMFRWCTLYKCHVYQATLWVWLLNILGLTIFMWIRILLVCTLSKFCLLTETLHFNLCFPVNLVPANAEVTRLLYFCYWSTKGPNSTWWWQYPRSDVVFSWASETLENSKHKHGQNNNKWCTSRPLWQAVLNLKDWDWGPGSHGLEMCIVLAQQSQAGAGRKCP